MKFFANGVEKIFEKNQIISAPNNDEYLTTLHLEKPKILENSSSSEEIKNQLLYYRSLLKQYEKTLHILKQREENLSVQNIEHKSYKQELKQDYAKTFQSYKVYFDEGLVLFLPHCIRPLGKGLKILLQYSLKLGTLIYLGTFFCFFSVITAVPFLSNLYAIAFLAGVISECIYAQKGKFFFTEFTDNENKMLAQEKHLEKILSEASRLADVEALTAQNIMLNNIGIDFVNNYIQQCHTSIEKLLKEEQKDDSLLESTQIKKSDESIPKESSYSQNSSKKLMKTM